MQKNMMISAVTLALAGCATTGTQPTAPQGLQSAFVLLGENGVPVARAITTDAVCPALEVDGRSLAMQVRMPAETIAQRKTASKPEDSKPSAFPVLTCDATLPVGARSATLAGRTLPLPEPEIKKIVVIGDTGCRMKTADNYFQSCNDSEKWAFREMVESAAAQKPDLVLHVGDYHYRENACPDGNKECGGSPWGYGWDTWKADFFDPATALLKAAPWVMVRGNHETCVRAGQGWWRFMDPRAVQGGRDCNQEQNDTLGDYSDPYAVPLGLPGAMQTQLIIFDSSKVGYKALPAQDPVFRRYTGQLQHATALSTRAPWNFFVQHHPLLGFAVERSKSGDLTVFPGIVPLQDGLKTLHQDKLFPAQVQTTIAGHVHLFQAVTYKTGQAAQFISGNGGSSLDVPLTAAAIQGKTPMPGAEVDFFSNSNEVGYMVLERQSDFWLATAWTRKGQVLTRCEIRRDVTRCTAS
ncbi:metallophosphoesterase family protein [Undibacterium luofuense]|uniref:Metallophosphoesterase n=1 Tax=Undibacterium luofuense TaxID=2828733 RepID=A0A941DLN1_9BURK|nr:metallophosphoesterase [Undibacterium luofuense]MBR7782309.1 metallophosphoesterase [Undibacterium luofuense]